MSETKTTRKQLPAYLILALIALAAALLLAVTNAITAGPIKAHEEAAQNAAFQSVMTADSFSTMSIPDGCNVTSLVEAKKDGKTIGYCAVSSAKGYGCFKEVRSDFRRCQLVGIIVRQAKLCHIASTAVFWKLRQ